MSSRASDAKRILGIVCLVSVCGFLVYRSGFDAGASIAMIRRSGGSVLWLVLPFVLIASVEAAAWSVTLGIPWLSRRSAPLLRARVGLESISLTVPGSALAADGVAPSLLGRLAGTDLAETVGGVAVKKWGIVFGHATALGLAVAVGGAFFARAGQRLDLPFAPRLLVGLLALVGLCAATGLGLALRGGFAERIRAVVLRLPWRALAVRAERLVDAVATVDSTARDFFLGRRRRVAILAAVSAGIWLLESFEVYVMLRVLGAYPSFVDVLAMEATLGLVRGLAFFSPGGLGVQEVATMSLVPALVASGDPALASGLIVLRRIRDVACIGLGYAVLASAFATKRRESVAIPARAGVAKTALP